MAGLADFIHNQQKDPGQELAYMELILHGLAEFQLIGKDLIGNQMLFKDDLAGALLDLDEDGDE